MRALPHVSFLYYNAIEERRQFMEKSLSNLTSKFQYFGGAMMIPIICLVVCGFCMGISAPLVNFILPQGSIFWIIASLFMKMGSLIMANIPIWFTVGIAFGLSRENKGWAALAGIFMMMLVNCVISTLLELNGITVATANVEGLMALGKTAEEAEVMVPMFKSVAGIFTYEYFHFFYLRGNDRFLDE